MALQSFIKRYAAPITGMLTGLKLSTLYLWYKPGTTEAPKTSAPISLPIMHQPIEEGTGRYIYGANESGMAALQELPKSIYGPQGSLQTYWNEAKYHVGSLLNKIYNIDGSTLSQAAHTVHDIFGASIAFSTALLAKKHKCFGFLSAYSIAIVPELFSEHTQGDFTRDGLMISAASLGGFLLRKRLSPSITTLDSFLPEQHTARPWWPEK